MLVNKYLLGEITDNKEKYENDPNFMMEAIRRSHDINLFFRCGPKVILDKYFVKFLIETFPENIDFLERIVHSYITVKESYVATTPKKRLKKMEDIITVLLSMSELEANHGNFESYYTEILLRYNAWIIEDMDAIFENVGDKSAGEMALVKYCFEGNTELINFFAWVLLLRIITHQKSSFKSLIQSYFSSLEDLSKRVRTFFYNYTYNYDKALAFHVITDKDFYKEILFTAEIENIDFNVKPTKIVESKVINLSDYRRKRTT